MALSICGLGVRVMTARKFSAFAVAFTAIGGAWLSPATAVTGSTSRVSLSTTGMQGNNYAQQSAISADGRLVAFVSASSNLVPADTNGVQDVFVRDRLAGTTSRVSVSSSGAQAVVPRVGVFSGSFRPAITADGAYVAFTSDASNLVPGDTNHTFDVFVRNRVAGTTSRVSVSSLGGQANGRSGSRFPSISADGRYVTFTSDASTLVSGDTNGFFDVFVRDRLAGKTSRVSVSGSGQEATGVSISPVISGNGRYVAFVSDAPNLVPADTNNFFDVFVRDRLAGTTSRVSVSGSDAQAESSSFDPAISTDGRYVAFESDAPKLVPRDNNSNPDAFVRDRVAGTTTRVNVSSTGEQAKHGNGTFVGAVSGNGRYVAFITDATNLVPGGKAGSDVYLRDQVAGITSRVSVSGTGEPGNDVSGLDGVVAMTPDGHHIAFASEASNLVVGDTNSRQDIFVRDRG